MYASRLREAYSEMPMKKSSGRATLFTRLITRCLLSRVTPTQLGQWGPPQHGGVVLSARGRLRFGTRLPRLFEPSPRLFERPLHSLLRYRVGVRIQFSWRRCSLPAHL